MYNCSLGHLALARRGNVTIRIIRRHASHLRQRLNVQELDAKWQQRWETDGRGLPSPGQRKSYVLPMFAYPSGALHMGHLRVYTISDVIARHRQMKGDHVLHPTGWDAFGLPAENAALERGIDPAAWTLTNIQKMKEQLKSMNTHFDWDVEIATCSPSFYKHTQRLFLMLHHRGLAYQAEAMVNWDPVDQTVLANEQVDANGRSWRSGAIVQQRMLRQWFFKITRFQEELLHDLDALGKNSSWPERVLTQQRNWIGKSRGATIRFEVSGVETECALNVFTTRPDTIFGVKYLALSLSHPLIQQLASKLPDLQTFIDQRATFGSESKEGLELPIRACNPSSRLAASSNPISIPIFAAPYVLDGYGEGAVMGVPAHDARDLAFWKQHRPHDNVAIVVADTAEHQVVEVPVSELKEAYTDNGILTRLCGLYAGMRSQDAATQIIEELAKSGAAEARQTWRLRDWLVSRQRYWGTPIPIIHCSNCGAVPVPEQDLPVELPKLDSSIKGRTGNPLDQCEDWVNVHCPSCGQNARRETDTMDTFVDSSWYYLRFADAHNENELFSLQSAASLLPVDTYIGGVEHAILHLLYARFIYKFLCKEGLVATRHKVQEPFSQLVAQGMVHGKTYSDPDTGKFLLPHELDVSTSNPVVLSTGKQAHISFEKMSKSKYNGVDPTACITSYGADATRAHILFAAPVSEVLQWDAAKIVGIQRWFQRVGRLVAEVQELSSPFQPRNVLQLSDVDAEMLLLTQATLTSINDTLENNIYALNTYVSDLIKLTNGIADTGIRNLSPSIAKECVQVLIQMLAPIAPALAEECWDELQSSMVNEVVTGQTKRTSIFRGRWPAQLLSLDEEAQLKARKNTQICAVQINGKLRFTVDVPFPPRNDVKQGKSKEHEEAVVKSILSSAAGQVWLREKNDWEKRRRIIVVNGGKVVNIVF